MVFKGNDGWKGDEKAILHAKSWDVYINKKLLLIKGGCYV